MSGRLSRNKGREGEREFFKHLSSLTNETIRRNLNQYRDRGHDHEGLIQGFAIEVKRAAVPKIDSWWKQAVDQAVLADGKPALAYRLDRQHWRIRIYCHDFMPNSVLSAGYWIEMPLSTFGFCLRTWEIYHNERVQDNH